MSETAQLEQTKDLLKNFSDEKLMAIVRTETADAAIWASTILLECGFRIIEIPYTVPDASNVIETLCDQFPEAIIGAGTVLEAREALNALGAGAQFLVSPVLHEFLIQFGLEQNILVFPGCMTPTEAYQAWRLGAPAIKFFPAESAGGPAFITHLKGPLPQIPVLATGGVTLEQIPAYLKAGALAVGVGSPLIQKRWIETRDGKALQKLALQYLDAARIR